MEISSRSSIVSALLQARHATNRPEPQVDPGRDPATGQAEAASNADAARPSGQPLAVLPLEMYAIPEWRADYGFELPRQLGTSADWFAEKYPQAAAASQADRAEYAERVQSHYRAVLKDNGIGDTTEHYQATIADRERSETLRQDMAERVQNDPRMVELMTLLGKPIDV